MHVVGLREGEMGSDRGISDDLVHGGIRHIRDQQGHPMREAHEESQARDGTKRSGFPVEPGIAEDHAEHGSRANQTLLVAGIDAELGYGRATTIRLGIVH